MTRFAPDSLRDYTGQFNSADGLNDSIFCASEPVWQLPCQNINSDKQAFAGARSRHPGGINILIGDGSVRFLKNSVNHSAWVALKTINAGEVISSDSY